MKHWKTLEVKFDDLVEIAEIFIDEDDRLYVRQTYSYFDGYTHTDRLAPMTENTLKFYEKYGKENEQNRI